MNYLPCDLLKYIRQYNNIGDITHLSITCKMLRNVSQEYLNENAVIIQRIYRHHRKGRKHRKRITILYRRFIWKCKRFQVELKLDSNPYIHSKTSRDYINRIYNRLNVSLHQDSDDDEDYSLTNNQLNIINRVKKNEHIYKRDIRNILSSLTLTQLKFV